MTSHPAAAANEMLSGDSSASPFGSPAFKAAEGVQVCSSAATLSPHQAILVHSRPAEFAVDGSQNGSHQGPGRLRAKGVDEPYSALLEVFQIPGSKLKPMMPRYRSYLPTGRVEGAPELATTRHNLAVLMGAIPVKDKNTIAKGLINELVDSPRQRGSTISVWENLHPVADFAEGDRRYVQVR